MRVHELKSITGERRRWNAETADKVLKAVATSQMSLSAFARTYGVNVQRLCWWRKRLGSRRVRPAVAFVPAVIPQAGEQVGLLVRLPGGIEVEAARASAVPPDWVAALARSLASRP